MNITGNISPCLWFDDAAEDAAAHYISAFGNGEILRTTHYGEAGKAFHRKPVGSVMTVVFRLAGSEFTALNGGPAFSFTEAISLQAACKSQAEIDHLWHRLGDGGEVQQCGWLKDRFGLSWQIVPTGLDEMLSGDDAVAADRVMTALFQMVKLDIATLERAYQGDLE